MRHKTYRKLIVYLVSVGMITASLPGTAWSPYAFAQQGQSSASQPTTPQVKQGPATSIRKPHRLIRKSQNQPLASVQQSPSGTTNLSPLTTTPTTSSNNAAPSQPAEPSPTGRAIGGFSTVSPLTTMAIGSTSMAAPIASPSVSTPSSQAPLPFAAASGGSSSSDTRRSGGRSMRSLATQMPFLAEVLSPPSLSVTPPPPSAPTPAIGLSPLALSFTAVQNGAAPASQSVTIANAGTGTLAWTASSNMAWLKVNGAASTSGTNAGLLAVTVSTTGLSPGPQSGMITVTASGAANTPQNIPVTFTITAAPTPTIGLTPTALSFTAVQNGAVPASQSVTITNAGTGTLAWTASSNMAWLKVNSATSATGTNAGTLTVSVNQTGLITGTQTGVISITASGATNTPQNIPVSFTITAAPVPPAIGASPSSLSFTAQQGGSNPAAQTLTVSNTGGGTLSWTASDNVSWLTVSPASGTGNGTVTVSATLSSLATGTYTGAITLSATGASTVTIPVSFTVTAAPVPPAIGASPSSLSFTAQQGGSNPAAQTLTVSNTGGGTLSWTASDNVSWLTVSPASGTGNGTVTVSATLSPLTTGTYTGVITLSATGASTVTIPVTFTVTAAPTLSVTPSNLTYTATQNAANPASQAVTVSTTGGTLTWTASDNAAWLSVTPGTGSGNSTVTASVNTASLTPGNYTGTITIAASGVTSQTVSVALTVNAPATSSVLLTWTANTEPDLLSYNIYRSTTPGTYGAPLANVQKPATTYTAAGLQVGTTYYFTITAVDSAGNESLRSNEVSRSIF